MVTCWVEDRFFFFWKSYSVGVEDEEGKDKNEGKTRFEEVPQPTGH